MRSNRLISVRLAALCGTINLWRRSEVNDILRHRRPAAGVKSGVAHRDNLVSAAAK